MIEIKEDLWVPAEEIRMLSISGVGTFPGGEKCYRAKVALKNGLVIALPDDPVSYESAKAILNDMLLQIKQDRSTWADLGCGVTVNTANVQLVKTTVFDDEAGPHSPHGSVQVIGTSGDVLFESFACSVDELDCLDGSIRRLLRAGG